MPFRLSLVTALPAALTLALPIPFAHAQPALAPSRAIANRLIVSYAAGAQPAVNLQTTSLPGETLLAWYPHLGIALLHVSDAFDRLQLARDPAVLALTEDRFVSADAVNTRSNPPSGNTAAGSPDALYLSAQGWAVRAVGGVAAPGPWDSTEGAGVRIAILDSGVDATHPDLAPNLALNLSEVDQAALPSPCDDGSPGDQQGHGTWTASLAAGALGPSTGLVAGVAPAATLLNIKVLERLPATLVSPSLPSSTLDPSGCSSGQAGGLLSWVLLGIEDAITAHADIVSMSFGMLVDSATPDGAQARILFDHVAHLATEAGIVLIASAGNDGLDLGAAHLVELPAEAANVLAVVASTNPSCAEDLTQGATCAPGPVTLPYYSNRGAPLHALAAPGGSYPAPPDAPADAADAPTGWITGACSSGQPGTVSGPPADPAHSFGCFGLGHTAYVQAIGTSASAPLAAGAAALLRAAHPGWPPATVVQALRSSALHSPGLLAPQINISSLFSTPSTRVEHLQ